MIPTPEVLGAEAIYAAGKAVNSMALDSTEAIRSAVPIARQAAEAVNAYAQGNSALRGRFTGLTTALYQNWLYEMNREWRFTDGTLCVLWCVELPDARSDYAAKRHYVASTRTEYNAGRHQGPPPAELSVAYDRDGNPGTLARTARGRPKPGLGVGQPRPAPPASLEKTPQVADEDAATAPGGETKLVPLPAVTRRRGLSGVRGLFPAMLATLEFVKPGASREEVLGFLRSNAPDVKTASLGVTINSYQSEFGVIESVEGRYQLTERGQRLLESLDPSHLADWLLTRVLGVDRAIAELRDRGKVPRPDLLAAMKEMNPGWTTLFTPQAILNWLLSLKVIQHAHGEGFRLTDEGMRWAERIHWAPEPLERDAPDTTGGIVVHEPPVGVRSVELPLLSEVASAVAQSGHFPRALVANLHSGLWSHPRRHFAVLTGLSGSGKTMLARAYGRAIADATASDAGVLVLPVQPGWYDPGALLGYVNPLRSDSYVRTAFLEFLLAAAATPTRPHVVVLDEMNLSHPEQYMAPLLSAMETGDEIRLHTEDDIFDGVPKAVPYPANLVLIGTVNMDETTHGLSDKVLDRAFVLEHWDIDLAAYPRWGERKSLSADYEGRARQALEALMGALAPARLHFGYRVVDSVLDYLAHVGSDSGAVLFDDALDFVVYAKVLPKMRGEDSAKLQESLRLCVAIANDHRLPRCGKKLGELQADLQATGAARFWR